MTYKSSQAFPRPELNLPAHSRQQEQSGGAIQSPSNAADELHNGSSAWMRLSRLVTGGFGSSTKSISPIKDDTVATPKTPTHRVGNPLARLAQARLVSSTVFETSPTSLDVAYNIGGEITAIDLNHARDCVVVAGRDVLKIIRVERNTCAEEFNIRQTVARGQIYTGESSPRKPPLTREAFDIHDVKWCHGRFSNVIATAAAFSRMVLYDVTAPVPITPRAKYGLSITRMNEHKSQVHKLAFNPHQSGQLLSASQDGTVTLWDLRDLRSEQATFKGPFPVGSMPSRSRFSHTSGGSFRDVKWSPADGHVFAAATDRGTVVSWDIRFPRTPRAAFLAHSGFASSVDWHPAGRWLASGGSDSTVKLWDMYVPAEERADGVTGRRSSGIIARPQWTVQTPFPVVNLQWRPPARSPIPTSSAFFDITTTGSGSFDSWTAAENASVANLPPGATATGSAWLTTQFSTTYSRDYPQVHVWDLRRPHVPLYEIIRPFRESGPASEDRNPEDDSYEGLFKYRPAGRFTMATGASSSSGSSVDNIKVEDLPSYAGRTAPTDMIWHSRDMLWAGGRDGIFCQVDVARGKMTYKPVERRAWTHVSVGARGQGVVIAAERLGSGSREVKDPVVHVPVIKKSDSSSTYNNGQDRDEIEVLLMPSAAVQMRPLCGPTFSTGTPLAKAIAIAKLKHGSTFMSPANNKKKKKKGKNFRIGADDAVDGVFLAVSRPSQSVDDPSGGGNGELDEGGGREPDYHPVGGPGTPLTPLTPFSISPDKSKAKGIRSRPSFSSGFGMAAALAAVGMRLGGENGQSGGGQAEDGTGVPAIWPPSTDVATVDVPGQIKGGKGEGRPSGPITDGLDCEDTLDDSVDDSVDDSGSTSPNTSSHESTKPPKTQKRKQKHWQRQVVLPIHVIPLDESLPKRGLMSHHTDGSGLDFVRQKQGRVVLPGMAPLTRPDGPTATEANPDSSCRLFLPPRLVDLLRKGTGQVLPCKDSPQSAYFEPNLQGLQQVCDLMSVMFEHNAQISSGRAELRAAQAFRILGLVGGWWTVERIMNGGKEMEGRVVTGLSGGMDEGKYEPGGLWPLELMYGDDASGDEALGLDDESTVSITDVDHHGFNFGGSDVEQMDGEDDDDDDRENGNQSSFSPVDDGRFIRRSLSESLSGRELFDDDLRPKSTPPEVMMTFDTGEDKKLISNRLSADDPHHDLPAQPPCGEDEAEDEAEDANDEDAKPINFNCGCIKARKILGLQYTDFMGAFDISGHNTASLSALPVPSPDFPIRLPGLMNQLMLLFCQSARTADVISQMLLLILPVVALVPPNPPSQLSGEQTVKQRYLAGALSSFKSALEVSLSPALGSDPSLIPAALRHLSSIAVMVDPLQAEAAICAYVDQLVRRKEYIHAAVLRRITFPIFVSVWEAGCIGVSVALGGGSCGRAVKGVYDWGGVRLKLMDDEKTVTREVGQLHRHLADLTGGAPRGRQSDFQVDLIERRADRDGNDIDWANTVTECRQKSNDYIGQGYSLNKHVSVTLGKDGSSSTFESGGGEPPDLLSSTSFDKPPKTLFSPSASLLTWRGLVCDNRTKCVLQQKHPNNLAVAVCDICSCLQSPFANHEMDQTRMDSVITASAIGLGMGMFADSHAKGFFAELVASQKGVGSWHGGRADHVVRVEESRRNKGDGSGSNTTDRVVGADRSGSSTGISDDKPGSIPFADMIFPPPVYPSVMSACLVCGHVAHASCKQEWFSATRVFSSRQRQKLHDLKTRRKANSIWRSLIWMNDLFDSRGGYDDDYSGAASEDDLQPSGPVTSNATANLWRESFHGQCHFPGCQCACLPVSDWGRKVGENVSVAIRGRRQQQQQQQQGSSASGTPCKPRTISTGAAGGGAPYGPSSGSSPHRQQSQHQHTHRNHYPQHHHHPTTRRPGTVAPRFGPPGSMLSGSGYGVAVPSLPPPPFPSRESQDEIPVSGTLNPNYPADQGDNNDSNNSNTNKDDPQSTTSSTTSSSFEDDPWDPYPSFSTTLGGYYDDDGAGDDSSTDDGDDDGGDSDEYDDDRYERTTGILNRGTDKRIGGGGGAGGDGIGGARQISGDARDPAKKSLLGAFFGRMK